MNDPGQLIAASASQIDDDTWALLCYLVEALPIAMVPFVINDISQQYPGHEILKALKARQKKYNEANEEFFGKGVPEF
jgi:hypothetical protein